MCAFDSEIEGRVSRNQRLSLSISYAWPLGLKPKNGHPAATESTQLQEFICPHEMATNPDFTGSVNRTSLAGNASKNCWNAQQMHVCPSVRSHDSRAN